MAPTPRAAPIRRPATEPPVAGPAPATRPTLLSASPPTAPFTTMPDGDTGAETGHVLFGRGDATLDPGDRDTLDALAAQVRPGGAVHVHGYASAEGDTDANRNLSAHRAVAVAEYLRGHLPEGTRVIAYAYGETTAFGDRAANRRAGVDLIAPGGLFNPDLGRRFSGTLLPPGGLTLGGALPSAPTLPTGLLPPSLSPGALVPPGPLRDPSPPWLTAQVPAPPQFDLGSVAADFRLRGVPYTARDGESLMQHYRFWYDNFTRWGMDPGLAATLVQQGTAFAARTDLSLQAPTEQERLDRAQQTSPTVLPVFNDTMMRWLFRRFHRDP